MASSIQFDNELNEVCRLRRIIENQEKSLANWRRMADADAGKIARLERDLASAWTDIGELLQAIQKDDWLNIDEFWSLIDGISRRHRDREGSVI